MKPRPSVSLQKQAASLCCGERRSQYTEVLLPLHHPAVCSSLQLANPDRRFPSPRGPIESVKLIQPNGFHQVKWKGNDTSGTPGPLNVSSTLFFPSSFLLPCSERFRVPGEHGWGLSLTSAPCYNTLTHTCDCARTRINGFGAEES